MAFDMKVVILAVLVLDDLTEGRGDFPPIGLVKSLRGGLVGSHRYPFEGSKYEVIVDWDD